MFNCGVFCVLFVECLAFGLNYKEVTATHCENTRDALVCKIIQVSDRFDSDKLLAEKTYRVIKKEQMPTGGIPGKKQLYSKIGKHFLFEGSTYKILDIGVIIKDSSTSPVLHMGTVMFYNESLIQKILLISEKILYLLLLQQLNN